MADFLTQQEIKTQIDFTSITYKDVKVLSNFLSDQGKILPRRVTGLSSKQQKKINVIDFSQFLT